MRNKDLPKATVRVVYYKPWTKARPGSELSAEILVQVCACQGFKLLPPLFAIAVDVITE